MRAAGRALLPSLALLLAAELCLRLTRPPVVEFARAHRRVHAYSRDWYVDLRPGTQTQFYMPGRSDGPLLNFLLTVDAAGLRGPDRPADAVPLGGPQRYLYALGDSFTMGWGVSFDAAWPTRLEGLLAPDVRVLNLGVDGFGAIAAGEKAEALAGRLPPTHVVWLLVPNDFDDDERVIRMRRADTWRHWLLEAGDLARRHSAVACLPFALRYWLLFRARPEEAGPKAPRATPDPARLVRQVDAASLPPAPAARPTLAAVLRLATALRERQVGLTLLVLYQHEFARQSLQLFRHARDHGLAPVLVAPPPDLCLRGEGHLNPLGNEALARLVAGLLHRSGRTDLLATP